MLTLKQVYSLYWNQNKQNCYGNEAENVKINELKQMLGVPRSLIFYYEKEGLVTPQRRANRYREYSEADVERLETILALRRLGFS